MVRVIVAIVAALAMLSATAVASANPHCAGNSDNVNLPSGHVNNFPGC